MAFWIRQSGTAKVEYHGVTFRQTTMHGPFETEDEAAIYWRNYAGVAPGEPMKPFYDEPELIEMEMPE